MRHTAGKLCYLTENGTSQGYLGMKYFVDPDPHWDPAGYWEQFRSLAPRLSKSAFGILSKTSFHDAAFWKCGSPIRVRWTAAG